MRINVRLDQGSTSWQIPYAIKNANSINEFEHTYEIERSLCLSKDSAIVQNGTVVVSTSSRKNITFQVRIEENSNSLTINEKKLVRYVKIGSPVYYYMNLTGISGYLHISVNSSEENVCGIISLHPLRCPFTDYNEVDLNENEFFKNGWQTISKFSDFPINADDFTKGKGVFIKFDTLGSGEMCGEKYEQNISDIKKSYELIVLPLKSNSDIIEEVIVTILIVVLICLVLIGMISPYLYRVRHKNNKVDVEKYSSVDNVDGSKLEQNPEEQPQHMKYLNQLCQNEAHTQSEVKKTYKLLYEQNELYFWLVILIGIFYGVPALQLVFKYQSLLQHTGNNDLCYYNFKCSFPMGKVHDFNHIISNIGYMALGIAFFIIVKYKKYLNTQEKQDDQPEIPSDSHTSTNYNLKGIPQHYGIFYALGYALFAEGVLSACYHFCPTKENFQFDTTFMYVIAVLCFVKIYQFRHPDMSSNAYKIFTGISIVILFEVIGIFKGSNVFWIILTILYIVFIMMMSTVLYRVDKWKRPWQQLTVFYYVSFKRKKE